VKTNYHEQEFITLKSPHKQERKLLHIFLRKRGFKPEDDFYELLRKGRCEPWQSSAVLGIDVRSGGEDIYETEEDIDEGLETTWDELRCDYPLATLPREYIADMVREVEALVTEFKLSVVWNGEAVDPVELAKRLNAIADQLSSEWDVPGSETIGILIEQEYGSR